MSLRPLLLPLACTAGLLMLAAIPSVAHLGLLQRSFCAAALALFAWQLALARLVPRWRPLRLGFAAHKQHYVQACVQLSLLFYWGHYWRPLPEDIYLLIAQLLFAYAFDALLTWSRGQVYTLGFGPWPVVLSMNLFLLFKPDWFVFQFLLIAVAFTAKAFIVWSDRGRRVHIFNPSAFALAIFSVCLLATRTTDRTWGNEIANTLNYVPNVYAFIFLVGLPGQIFFGVTTMTMSAVVTTYAFGLLYFASTGTYFFFDSYIPIAAFLGMHLLFTDPSTSPRTELGRVIFGITYGLSVVALYRLLGDLGAPTFYDKLLAVPFMNLMTKPIDRLAASARLKSVDPSAVASFLVGRARNVAYVGVWTVAFVLMSAVNGVGDHHPGHWVPFWQRACEEDRRDACRNLAVLLAGHCGAGSGWACNEYGILLQPERRPDPAKRLFQQACDLGFHAGCNNVALQAGEPARTAPPTTADYPIVLREGKGRLPTLTSVELYRRACSQGFVDGCTQLQMSNAP